MEAIESFVEKTVYEICTPTNAVGSLSEDEETTIMALIRKNPELRATLGIGVVMAGAEAKGVAKLLNGKPVSEALVSALDSGKNVVLF